MANLPVDSDDAWEPWRARWHLREDTIYLNHGSFGPPPDAVREAQQSWKDRLDRQPMDFFLRVLPREWHEARERLAAFLKTAPRNLIFASNATEGVNLVAHNWPLQAGDEVLLTDHEYGAVQRIWQRRTAQCQATCRIVSLPGPFESPEQIIDGVWREVRDTTRLIVISHVTSPTAVTLPIAAICRRAADRGLAVCVDGPHAIAQLPVNLDELGCAFYAASCHKWLSAPFGSGFLYVAPAFQAMLKPVQLSWGLPPPATPEEWDEEFYWLGTRDPSALLAIPAAIEFLADVGADNFRARTHWLARYARQQLMEFQFGEPLTPDSPDWYGAMAHVPLPPGDGTALQNQLWSRFGIEVPIVQWSGRRWIRVSCHLYNRATDIDALVSALRELL